MSRAYNYVQEPSFPSTTRSQAIGFADIRPNRGPLPAKINQNNSSVTAAHASFSTSQSQLYPYQPQQVLNTSFQQQQVRKGESRVEYIPYQREVTEYVTQEVVEYVPRQRTVTDYYAVQHEIEYVPQFVQNKYIEYVPVERVEQKVEYFPVEKQTILSHPQVTRDLEVVNHQITNQKVEPQAPIYYNQVQQQPLIPKVQSPLNSQRVQIPQQAIYQPNQFRASQALYAPQSAYPPQQQLQRQVPLSYSNLYDPRQIK